MKTALLLLAVCLTLVSATSSPFKSSKADLKELENVLQQDAETEEWKWRSRKEMEEELQKARQGQNVNEMKLVRAQQDVVTNVTGVGRFLPYFKPGRIIYIFGKAPDSGIVEFDLLPVYDTPSTEIVLRLTIDIDNYHILRDTYVHNKWLYEENVGYSGIIVGRMFSLTIICQCYGYEIAVQGYHFTTYLHRIPFTKEMWIGINQDIYIDEIEYY